jgi:hypothetical protein
LPIVYKLTVLTLENIMSEPSENEKGPVEVVTGVINPERIGGIREGEGDTSLPEHTPDPIT